MRIILLLFSCALMALGQAAGPPLSVDAAAARHPISPDIYGINDYGNSGLSTELAVGVNRWGGDASTRYNWLNDSYNAGSDWYFTSFPYTDANPQLLPFGSTFDQFVDKNLTGGERSLGTIPELDWLPSQRTQMCSFSVAKYGPQQEVNPYDSDCGNGLKPDGKTHIVNDPADVGTAVDQTFAQAWLKHLISRYGTASDGGVKFWSLDNEPEWWFGVHIDIHPNPATYDEMLSRAIRYASAVKNVDPSAMVTGPVPSGWMGYFYSAADFVAGWNSHSPWNYDTDPVDRLAHGNVPWVDYFLQQMLQYEQQNGVRLLDVLDIHGYVSPAGIAFGEAGGGSDVLRLTSTRALWDPNYLFSDPVIDAPPQLVPRLRNWVASDYPGTKIAITEYNWGAVDDITGAIAEADILGIFGREGLDLGTMWSPPTQTQPAANAFRMYLNYDGLGGHFGSTSVSATTGDPDQLSIFAAQRSDQALTVMVLNKATSDLASSVPLANFTAAGTANVFTYSAANLGAIAHGSDIAVDPVAGVSYTFPARSITLFVIPAAADPTIPQPVISSIVNAASGVGAQVAPGEMITITGANFATSVDQIEIRFNGSLAPVLNVSADGTTINAVVPYRAALTPNVWVWVESNGVRSAGMSIPVVQTLPGIFWIADAYGAVINRDTPASAGDVVSIIATGEGVTNPPGVDGRMAVNVLPRPVAACTASIGGSAAQVFYCGASPGDVTGRLRVDVQVPSGLRAGDHPVVLTIGSASSRGSVLLPVR